MTNQITPIGDIDYSTYSYHPTSERIVEILKTKTQSSNTGFFRILTAYYMAKIASTMRTNIDTHDRGKIPANVYALNLAPSGTGKGFATFLLEEEIIRPFKDVFMQETFQTVSEKSLRKLAVKRAAADMGDEDAEYDRVCAEFESCGPMLFSFDSGTTPAVKQMRTKLLMAGSGAISMEIDEIGSNLLSNQEVLVAFLELYDVGRIKEKLIKHTAESKRIRAIDGKTPANMMLFGTPNKLLEDPRLEDELISMIDTGYGRRCLFGYSRTALHRNDLTAEELYEELTNSDVDSELKSISQSLSSLAGVNHFNISLPMSKATHIHLLEYKIDCTNRASKYKEYQEMLKTELEHRYYKALKLAGTYAFIDKSDSVTDKHIEYAIRLTEDSGDAFTDIISREKPYERLAKYIAEVGKEITIVDLMENLSFFKGSEQHRKHMLSLAATFGYQNNIIIRKSYVDDIEFYHGETLEETDLDELILAYSEDSTQEYEPAYAPFIELDTLFQSDEYYFTSHHFIGNYRINTKVIPGFNLVVLDIDEGLTIDTARLLLRDYTYKMYTTKRHTDTTNRFRIILPISHILKLGVKEYFNYMENVFEWLPFYVDTAAKDIARKWATNKDAEIFTNEGIILDATLFIPQTKKSDQIKTEIAANTNLSSLESWFLRETREGNRSHMLLKYGLVLKDAKYPIDAIRNKIDEFNIKLDNPLDDNEISRTIMITIAKRMGTN